MHKMIQKILICPRTGTPLSKVQHSLISNIIHLLASIISMEVTLRSLALNDKSSFLNALNENWENNFVFAHYYESLANNSFETYIEVLPEITLGKLIPSDHVPSTILFAFTNDGVLVGRVSIRHQISGQLLNVGGHIGYGVLPSQRRKGYATDILTKSLIYAKIHLPHLSRVLLTCDVTNTASIRTIKKNGGILENVYSDPSLKTAKNRYWIKL